VRWTVKLLETAVVEPRRDAFAMLGAAAHGLRQLPSAVRHGLIWPMLDCHST
jgi:hypothetical protein